MKIRNLIYGTAVVCLVSVFWSNPALCSKCNFSCSKGTLKCDAACSCYCEQGITVPGSGMTELTVAPQTTPEPMPYVEPGPIIIPDEPQETCETKEINGDITSCCHTSSGSSSDLRDLFNNNNVINKLDGVDLQNTNAVEGEIRSIR